MTAALSCSKLRVSVTQASSTNSHLTEAGIKFETASTVLALLTLDTLEIVAPGCRRSWTT